MARGAGLAFLLLAPLPVGASDPAIYPLAQCAAFWFGFDDYARRSAYLERRSDDRARADAFLAAAIRVDGGNRARVTAYVTEQRPAMDRMMEAMIYAGDRQSREIFERLSETCRAAADRHPETRDLD